MKYLRYATFGCKVIVIRKSEFVAKTQFLFIGIIQSEFVAKAKFFYTTFVVRLYDFMTLKLIFLRTNKRKIMELGL